MRGWMASETWFGAAQAVAAGFADEVDGALARAATVSRAVLAFRHVPMEVRAMATAGPKPQRTPEQRARLRRRLCSSPCRPGSPAIQSVTKRIASAARGCGGDMRCTPWSRPSKLTIVLRTRPNGQQARRGSSAITTTTGKVFRTDNVDDHDCRECVGAGALHVPLILRGRRAAPPARRARPPPRRA